MKKLTVIVATLLMAVYAQAGSIDWAVTGALTIKNQADTPVGGGVTVYLVLAGSQASIISSITAGTFLTTPPAGVLGTAVTGLGSNVAQTFAQTDQLAAGTSYAYSVLVFSTPTAYDNTPSATGYYKFATQMTSIANADLDHTYLVAFGADNFTGASYTAYTVVPEPTSMALFALGVAAVGLRRRFRK